MTKASARSRRQVEQQGELPGMAVPQRLARVPKDWISKAVFVPGVQPPNREIVVNGNTWVMGIDNPIAKNPTPSKPITLNHIKIAFAVLTFWRGDNPVSMSLSELAQRCADSRGGRYYRDLLDKLNDLRNYWVSVSYEDGRRRRFALLKSVDLVDDAPPKKKTEKGGQSQMWLDRVELHEEFAELLRDFARTIHLRFDVMKTLTSDLAQSIYLFLPSRAYHRSKTDPFEIGLETLFEQLELAPQPKSVRYKLLTQNKRSVMKQIDGAEILIGKLRVKLTETRDKSDYKLMAWVEGKPEAASLEDSQGPLIDAWRKSGRTDEALRKALGKLAELDDYDRELLTKAGVSTGETERFLRQAKVLVGDGRFHAILSDAKAERLEGRAADNPTGAVIWRLLREIEQKREGWTRKKS
jgi:hypothetical protein